MSQPAATTDESIATDLDDTVRCATCRAEITVGRLGVAPSGSHEHTFRNPAGYSWTIACFRDAAGCRSTGDLTAEASWFVGYEWCFAPCSTCGRHLGWWFVATGSSFVGLIVSRIER